MQTFARANSVDGDPRMPSARLTGAVYLAYFLTAIFAQVVAARESRAFGDAANLVADALYVAVTVLLYRLFAPVNQKLSLVAAIVSLAGCLVQTLGVLHVHARYLSPLVFFGPYCVAIGYLIVRSTYLPKLLGVLMTLAGCGWVAVLSPSFPRSFSTCVEVLGIVAEGSLMLWLLARGIDRAKWLAGYAAGYGRH